MKPTTSLAVLVATVNWTTATNVTGVYTGSANKCCASLASELPDAVFRRNSTAYRDSIESYWSISARELLPDCVVTPKDVKDIPKILRVLAPQSKDDSNCQFALRGGGHTPIPGAANIDYGITIDMQNINSVELSNDKTTVHIGAGSKWGKVYAALVPHRLAAVGGGASDVGVAGYLTGGGLSSFGGRYGWSTDTVVNFEIALASGDIVNANATSHPDLFQALKGGTNNFGIVTRFDMQTFKQGDVWNGIRSSSIEYFPETIQAIIEHATNYDQDTVAIANFLWSQSTGFYITTILHHSKPEPNPPALQPYLAIPQTGSNLGVFNLTVSADVGNKGYPEEKRFLFASATHYPNTDLLVSIFEIMNRTLKAVPQDPDFTFKLTYQALTRSFLSNSEGPTPNSFGLDVDVPYLISVRVEIEWTDRSKDFYYNHLVKRCISLANWEAKRMGLYHRFVVPTAAGPWQDVVGSYGKESVDRLRKTSRKYDPNGVFQLQVPGGFKLGVY